MLSDYHGVHFYREGQIAAFIVRPPDGQRGEFIQNPTRRDFVRVAIQYGLNPIDYDEVILSAAEQGATTILWDIEKMLKSQAEQEESASDGTTMILSYSDDTKSVCYQHNSYSVDPQKPYYNPWFSESDMIEFMTSENMFNRRILFEVEVKYS